MKTTTLSLFTLILVQTSKAQLSLSHFYPGETKNAIEVSAEPLSNTAGGQNLTWNFSNLNATGSNFEMRYITPTPEMLNRFPGTQYAMEITEEGNNIYFTFRGTASGWEQTGLITTIEGEEVANEFKNPKLYIPSDLSFGSIATDNFYSVMDLGGSGFDFTIATGGQVRAQVDATGTIVLPNGQTVTGVTRLFVTENYTDSIKLNIPGFPSDPDLIEGRTKIYSWYKNDGSGNPLLFSLVHDSTFSDGEWNVNTSAFYIVNTTTSTGHKHLSNLRSPYPNQVSDVLHIPFDNSDHAPAVIMIMDALGRPVLAKKATQLHVENSCYLISLNELMPGTYYLTTQYKDGKTTKPYRIIKL